jgi:hypothetical protein
MLRSFTFDHLVPSPSITFMNDRNIKADVRWGVRQALILTGIVFVPAAIVVAGKSMSELLVLAQILGLYLIFGAGAGILIGLCRPWLKKGSGAALVGSVIGAIGFIFLMYFPQPGRPTPPFGLGVASAIMGAFVGGGLGWWMWLRAERWRRR